MAAHVAGAAAPGLALPECATSVLPGQTTSVLNEVAPGAVAAARWGLGAVEGEDLHFARADAQRKRLAALQARAKLAGAHVTPLGLGFYVSWRGWAKDCPTLDAVEAVRDRQGVRRG